MVNKKTLLFISLVLSFMLFPKDTLALSSSEYASRNNCGGRYEVAGAHTDGVADFVSCHNTYQEAKNFMLSNGASDLIIFDRTSGTTKIVDAQYGLLDLSVNPETLTYFYESSSLTTRKYTYMDTGSLYGGVDGALLDVNYGTSVKVMIGGLSAWIKNGTYEIVPLNWVKSSSSYTVNDNIRHNYVAKIQNTYSGSAGSTIGPKPDQLSRGTYYSYDGHYFYTNRLTMVKDYKNNTRANSVNKNDPYYNYYMFLSNHSKTVYSSLNIDEYIRNNMGISKALYGDKSVDNSSRLYGMGNYLYYSQEKYGVNAILSLSLNRNESGNGRSSIAIKKNNGFGLNAVDSNPSEAANYFPAYANSILEYASTWVTDGYADPADYRYFGPAFGDKYIGMNVKYASDTYWSEKMAANYYSFDKSLGLQDYNFYQLGLVNGPTNAYSSPSQTSSVVYTYPEKDDNLIIVGEVSNTEGTWYKVQSDKSNTNGTWTTKGDYNWNSYVYLKKDSVTKINKAKNGYKSSSDITEYSNKNYSYDLYSKDGTLNPKVAVTTSDTNYYYDSSLSSATGQKVLNGKYLMVYSAAYDGAGKVVSYLVTSDYKYDQKHWVKASSIKFTNGKYAKVRVDAFGQYTWVNSSPHDLEYTVIGGQYNYSYVPILDSTSSDGYYWYKVPVDLSSNNNSYGWTIKECTNVYLTEYSYSGADSDNSEITVNNAPTITATDKTIVQGEEINLKDGVSATDKEDGNLTSKIQVSGSVDNNKVGEYEITYTVTDNGSITTTKKIKVTVIKNEEPVIKAENITLTINDSFDELDGVSATDKEDGDLTKKIEVVENTVDTKKLGEYIVTYKVIDSYKQEVTLTITVEVVKNQEPVIKAKDLKLTLNQKFNELDGVSATDKEDGDLTEKLEVIENTVDTTQIGEYIVIYKVVDSYGNEVTKEIKVEVSEKIYQEKDGEFSLESLKFDKDEKVYNISGYLIIYNMNNSQDDMSYEFVLKNKNNDSEYSIEVDSWLENVPYELGYENGYDYNNSWFKGKLDMSDIPQGDYDLYMRAYKGDYYTEQVVDNLFNKSIDKRSEDNLKGYSFKVLLSLKSKKIELSIRDDGLLTTSSAPTFRNMINDYDEIKFTDNALEISGTSYNYGATYSNKDKITRELIFENVETFEQYSREVDTVKDFSYKVTSTDNKDKSYAWYYDTIDISDLEKGTYSLIVHTKTEDADDYGEVNDIFGAVKDISMTKDNKTYTITLNKKRQNRIELIVK